MARPNDSYWRTNLGYILTLLLIWFGVSFGGGILAVDTLDRWQVAGFGLGFWVANQGSILVFCLLIGIYSLLMKRLDRRHAARTADGDPRQ
ncbi:MAG: DUF4212 domain-containing protein [Desulfuromonadales bacterium]|nr:DUF4212 domain-containing protein [Desulfuromonadales bacterium]